MTKILPISVVLKASMLMNLPSIHKIAKMMSEMMEMIFNVFFIVQVL